MQGFRMGAAAGALLIAAAVPLIAQAATAAKKPAPAQEDVGWAGDCPGTLKMHGLLSRARVACGFRFYSERMLKDAGQCQKHTAKPEVTKALTSGVKLFDAVEKRSGHKAACSTMAQKFPMVVQP